MTSGGQILPFARSTEEIRLLAERRHAQGDYVAALELLRICSQRAYEPQTALATARAYAAIQCWEKAVAAYALLTDDADYAAEGFFGLGACYYAVQLYPAACDCLTLAFQMDAEAEFVPDAMEMLESMEMEMDTEAMPPDPIEKKLQKRVDRAIRALDRERGALAVRQMRRALSVDRRSSGLWSLLAFAHLAEGSNQEALVAARKAVRCHGKQDIRALCALASALGACGSKEAADAYLRRAAEQVQTADDQRLLAQTACEMGAHGFVLSLLLPEESIAPFGETLLHTLASAFYNTGKREEALMRWRLLLRISPDDAVAEYRLRVAESEAPPQTVGYGNQLPLTETLIRLDQLRIWVHEGPDALLVRWQQDIALENLLRWGLSCEEPGVRQAICGVLVSLGDMRAQHMLRALLCDAAVPEDAKQSALTALFQMDAQPPFYAMMDDRLTMVHVSRVQPQQEARREQAGSLLRQAVRLLGAVDALEKESLARLCEKAGEAAGTFRERHRAQAAVLAHCMLEGRPCPLEITHTARRKVERLARHLVREEKQ